MDWPTIGVKLGLRGPRWHWRLMRWERAWRELMRGGSAGSGTPATWVILAVNLVAFSLMVIQGAVSGRGFQAIFSPDVELLIQAGAQFWPLVEIKGQWWRCLTYAYTHGGVIHLLFNMMVLYQVGPAIEAEIGTMRFLTLYTVTALTATAAGLFWHPIAPVVGASGSLFGLIGFAIVYYHRVGGPAAHNLRNFMLRWAAFAFVFGLVVGADNAGHLGGALGGAALGAVLPLGIRGRMTLRPLFNFLGTLCIAATVVSLVMLVLSWARGY
ncbi:MAG: rhomboid family intramembrane serine protease [Desulfuromonas sp.]|nr:rhomboid family intramembrane serine protease [Desulfuromonas sp.]